MSLSWQELFRRKLLKLAQKKATLKNTQTTNSASKYYILHRGREERLDFDPDVNTYVVEFNSPPEGAEDRYTDFLNIQIRSFEGSTYHADLESGHEANQTTTDNLATLGEYLTLVAYADDFKEVYKNTYDNFQNLSFDFVSWAIDMLIL